MLPRWLLGMVASALLVGCAAPVPERAPVVPQPSAPATAKADEAAQSPRPVQPPASDAPAQVAVPPEAPNDAPQEWRELARGTASWYGRRFHGRRTASGETFDMNSLTAAHRTLPFGTVVRVRSLVNGREVDVRINDRGPHLAGRIIDLSRAAAEVLGLREIGLKEVVLSVPPELAAGQAQAGEPQAGPPPPRASKPRKRKPVPRPRPAP